MFNYFKRLLGIVETDLSKIVSQFERTLSELQAHIDHHDNAAEAKVAESGRLAAEARDHVAAATKAERIQTKIADLISG